MPFFSFITVFVLNTIVFCLIYISIANTTFFWFLLHGISLFSGFHVQSVFLTGRVSCRQSKWVLVFFFFLNQFNYSLSLGFSSSTYKVIIDRDVVIAILFIICQLFCTFFCSFFFCLSLWFDDFLQWYAQILFLLSFVYLLQDSNLWLP